MNGNLFKLILLGLLVMLVGTNSWADSTKAKVTKKQTSQTSIMIKQQRPAPVKVRTKSLTIGTHGITCCTTFSTGHPQLSGCYPYSGTSCPNGQFKK